MRLICEIEGCGTALSERWGEKGGLMICPSCRSGSYRWKKRSTASMRAYHEALQLRTHRIEYYDPKVLKAMNDAKKDVAAASKRASKEMSARH